MLNGYSTDQERFWAGRFGDEYTGRNAGAELVAGNTALFARIFALTDSVESVIEFGANVGLNLVAIRTLLPRAGLSGVEINAKAAEELGRLPGVRVYTQSILDFSPDRTWDFVFTKGVLIHLNPDRLPEVYDLLHRSSKRYICVAEYYNPTPVSIPYRGETDRLFKRDFAGEMLDRFQDLRLVHYGFVYRRDIHFRQDDVTWFLLEKTGGTGGC